MAVLAVSGDFISRRWHRVANLKPRLRPDVLYSRHVYRGEIWYVLRSLSDRREIHRLVPSAWNFVQRLDGHNSVEAAWRSLVNEDSKEIPSQEDVIGLLIRLSEADLIIGLPDGEPDDSMRSVDRTRRATLLSTLLSPTAIRIPIFNPDRLLSRLNGFARMLFSWPAALIWVLVVLLAGFGLTSQIEDFKASLSEQVLSSSNLILIGIIFFVLKALHELGHGLAAKSLGLRIDTFGIAFLVFMPLPYLDVSEANLLPSRWQRAMVAAAGMIVEIFISALAVFVWMVAEPETLVRTVAHNIVIIASVATVVFNVNPLLKFDGYFILTDVLEIPNLDKQSSRFWLDRVRFCLGAKVDPDPVRKDRIAQTLLALYAPTAIVFRLFIGLSISLFVAQKYPFFGVIVAALVLGRLVVWPLINGLYNILKSEDFSPNRGTSLLKALFVLCLVQLLLFGVPAPRRVISEGVVWLPEEAFLRVKTSGFVEETIYPSRFINTGATVLSVFNPALDAKISALTAETESAKLMVESSYIMNKGTAIAKEAQLTMKLKELEQAERFKSQEILLANANGNIEINSRYDLVGRYIREGELIGYILPERGRLVRVAVLQSQADTIRKNLRRVNLRLADDVKTTIEAEIVHQMPAGTHELASPALGYLSGGLLPTRTDSDGIERSMERVFYIDLLLPELSSSKRFGMQARVRFELTPKPIGIQFYDSLRLVLLRRLNWAG